MSVYYEGGGVTVLHGDCIEMMRALPDASVHAVVTDPPYGLEFMGKEWDSFRGDVGRGVKVAEERAAEMTPAGQGHSTSAGPYLAARVDSIRSAGRPFQQWCEDWAREAMRVLKPGGHLLAFGGSRTWHWLAAGIEDAGFEMRDSIAWLYGSGFPKSMSVAKAIASGGGRPEDIRRMQMGDSYQPSGRGRVNYDHGGGSAMNGNPDVDVELPATARQWDGWGTALKPSFEPIVVARKPLGGWTFGQCPTCDGTGEVPGHEDDGDSYETCGECAGAGRRRFPVSATVAANVLAHGTGALNIDASRVGAESTKRTRTANDFGIVNDDGWVPTPGENGSDSGRWPTNVVLDESQAAALDEQSGTLASGMMRAGQARQGKAAGILGEFAPDEVAHDTYGDSGGASRFFPTFRYEAKAPTSERPSVDGVQHPTVKPLDLMRWLVRLVTPPAGTVLEPFAGSGTTVEACLREGFSCIAIEREADYLPLIRSRIEKDHQQSLFGDWEGGAA